MSKEARVQWALGLAFARIPSDGASWYGRLPQPPAPEAWPPVRAAAESLFDAGEDYCWTRRRWVGAGENWAASSSSAEASELMDNRRHPVAGSGSALRLMFEEVVHWE